jgi:hypothetical protein
MYNDIKIEEWLSDLSLETETKPKEFRFFGLNATIEVWRKGGTYRERNSKSHLSVNMLGESVWDNLMNRRNRPTKIWKMVGETALASLGMEEELFAKMYWSQKAGCGCGCSPAFIMPNVFGYYFSIKVEADPMLEKEEKELPDRVPILISDSEEDLLKRTPLNV